MSATSRGLILIACLTLTGLAQNDAVSSKNPPKGPPWTRSFFEARAQAVESGRPIFIYSTKTY